MSSRTRSGFGSLGERLRKPTTPFVLVDNQCPGPIIEWVLREEWRARVAWIDQSDLPVGELPSTRLTRRPSRQINRPRQVAEGRPHPSLSLLRDEESATGPRSGDGRRGFRHYAAPPRPGTTRVLPAAAICDDRLGCIPTAICDIRLNCTGSFGQSTDMLGSTFRDRRSGLAALA